MVDANPKREQTKDSMNYRERSVIVAAFTDNAAYQILRIIQGKDGSVYFVSPKKERGGPIFLITLAENFSEKFTSAFRWGVE